MAYNSNFTYNTGDYATYGNSCWTAAYWNIGEWWNGYAPGGSGDAWTQVNNYQCP